MPLTVWAWFTAALLSVIAFSVLLAALTLLLSQDRHAGTSFFLPAGDLVNGTLHASTSGNGSSAAVAASVLVLRSSQRSTSRSFPAWDWYVHAARQLQPGVASSPIAP